LQAVGWLHAAWSILIVVAVTAVTAVTAVVLVLVGLVGTLRTRRLIAGETAPASDESLLDVAETTGVVPHAEA
jgi:hypothetical protein